MVGVVEPSPLDVSLFPPLSIVPKGGTVEVVVVVVVVVVLGSGVVVEPKPLKGGRGVVEVVPLITTGVVDVAVVTAMGSGVVL